MGRGVDPSVGNKIFGQWLESKGNVMPVMKLAINLS